MFMSSRSVTVSAGSAESIANRTLSKLSHEKVVVLIRKNAPSIINLSMYAIFCFYICFVPYFYLIESLVYVCYEAMDSLISDSLTHESFIASAWIVLERSL